jgi:hypothetical protein
LDTTPQVTPIQEVVHPPSSVEAPDIFRRILVPVELTPHSRGPLGLALRIAGCFRASEIFVLHVAQFTGDDFLRGLGDPAGVGDLVRASESRLVRHVDNLIPGSSRRVSCKAIVDNDLATGIRLGVERFRATIVVLHEHAEASVFRSSVEKITRSLTVPVLRLPAEFGVE